MALATAHEGSHRVLSAVQDYERIIKESTSSTMVQNVSGSLFIFNPATYHIRQLRIWRVCIKS